MPSEDFWSDLPSEKKKQSAGKKTKKITTPDLPPVEKAEVARTRPLPTVIIRGLTALGVGIGLVASATLGVTFALAQGANFSALDTETVEVEPVVFEVARGASARTVATQLEDEGLIISRWPFLFRLALNKETIRAGTYTLSPNMTIQQIIDQIANGTVREHQVTIPEGWRLEQIADLLSKNNIVSRDEFLAAATYDPVRYTLPEGVTLAPGASLEGLLFPDTYRFNYGVTSKEIVTKMLDNFRTRTQGMSLSYNTIILASIVEREAKLDEERPMIAGVYANRLKNNLRLEADPTVQYAKATRDQKTDSGQTANWWPAITLEEYHSVKSSFNTYLVSGLPPAPIANPGLKALQAAASPAEHNYFFFLHGADGTTHYAVTKEGHDQNKVNL